MRRHRCQPSSLPEHVNYFLALKTVANEPFSPDSSASALPCPGVPTRREVVQGGPGCPPRLTGHGGQMPGPLQVQAARFAPPSPVAGVPVSALRYGSPVRPAGKGLAGREQPRPDTGCLLLPLWLGVRSPGSRGGVAPAMQPTCLPGMLRHFLAYQEPQPEQQGSLTGRTE